jgi:alpha-ribazole phosphatase
MTGPTSWWWIRHAPVPGTEGRLNGQRDVDCDTSDASSFQGLARILPRDAISVVSSLKRTRQTFDAIAAAGESLPEPIVEPDFIEQSFGRWEGLSWAEMQARDPEAYAAFWKNPTRNAPPGGESFEAQMQRTAAAIERLTAAFAGRDIVSISHGGTIRAAVAVALGLAPEAAMAIVIDNLSMTRLSLVHDRLLSPGCAAWLVQGVNLPCPCGRRGGISC